MEMLNTPHNPSFEDDMLHLAAQQAYLQSTAAETLAVSNQDPNQNLSNFDLLGELSAADAAQQARVLDAINRVNLSTATLSSQGLQEAVELARAAANHEAAIRHQDALLRGQANQGPDESDDDTPNISDLTSRRDKKNKGSDPFGLAKVA